MIDKILSGRWILTVTCAGVFFWAAISGQLSNEGIAVIVTMVFKDYFARTDRTK